MTVFKRKIINQVCVNMVKNISNCFFAQYQNAVSIF